jgi:hypothetical protein
VTVTVTLALAAWLARAGHCLAAALVIVLARPAIVLARLVTAWRRLGRRLTGTETVTES